MTAACLLLLPLGCSSARKTTPELSKLEGKKVALIEVEGEPSARSVAEIALINQVATRGSFVLVSKKEVEAARVHFSQDTTDWKGVGKRAGADYALRVRVLKFDADTREGYSTEEIEDSQLAAERGEKERITKRVYKVKSMKGDVRFQMDFADLRTGDDRSGIAEHSDRVVVEARTQAAHLPPKLRFLEGLSNIAFQKFFDENE